MKQRGASERPRFPTTDERDNFRIDEDADQGR